MGGDKTCFRDGKLEFARGDEKPDGSYKTYVFPCFHHNGVVYQSDDVGLEMAFNYRLGCVREPERPGYHEYLMQEQETFFREDTEFERFVISFELYLTTWFEQYGDLDEELIKYAQKPHPKRKLRLRALRSILDAGDMFHATFNRRVTGKVKKAELAKYMKATRLINDLTCEGSLLAGFVADQAKSAMAKFTIGRCFQFIKTPDLRTLSMTFDKLINPDGIYFPFFSDDSCVSIRCLDGVFMANVDISACDGSHGKCVFEVLERVTRGDSRLHRFVAGAIRQCEMPLTLISGATKQKVVLKPNAPTLYSGSTLTTLVNNFANISIYHAILRKLKPDLMRSDCEDVVRSAAESAGYIVTVQVCDTYHKLQFLKHSPCVAADGTLVPVLNLGVILRSLGCCWGDLPTYKKTHGVLSFAQRAYLYNVSQVQCYTNCVSHSLLINLRKRFRRRERIVHNHSYVVDNITTDMSSYTVSDSELALRYDCSPEDIVELSQSIWTDGVINLIAGRAILSLDYGLC